MIINSKWTELNDRLISFFEEESGWDGEDRVPAHFNTIQTILDVVSILPADIKRPGASMGCDGSVCLVWQDDNLYCTMDFKSPGTYAYLVSNRTSILRSGICESTQLELGFLDYVRKVVRS